MSRLIDADALLEGIKIQMFDEDYDITCVISDIENASTIDAVEVVRCRDCKWWNGYYRECESPNWNTGTDKYIVQPAGMFCGWGERRADV